MDCNNIKGTFRLLNTRQVSRYLAFNVSFEKYLSHGGSLEYYKKLLVEYKDHVHTLLFVGTLNRSTMVCFIFAWFYFCKFSFRDHSQYS